MSHYVSCTLTGIDVRRFSAYIAKHYMIDERQLDLLSRGFGSLGIFANTMFKGTLLRTIGNFIASLTIYDNEPIDLISVCIYLL